MSYALWSLPPGTRTRALRFTHRASGTEQSFAGFLGGALIMGARVENIAPLALAGASSDDQEANLINNQQDDKWAAWSNLALRKPEDRAVISPQNPESLTLTWPAPVKLNGLELLWAGFSDATIQSYNGPADRNPRDATDGDWRDVATVSDLKSGLARSCGATASTSAKPWRRARFAWSSPRPTANAFRVCKAAFWMGAAPGWAKSWRFRRWATRRWAMHRWAMHRCKPRA